jgi:hypothetical protein
LKQEKKFKNFDRKFFCPCGSVNKPIVQDRKVFVNKKNLITTVKLGYNEHILSQIGHYSAQINPVITNPGCNEQKWPVPS